MTTEMKTAANTLFFAKEWASTEEKPQHPVRLFFVCTSQGYGSLRRAKLAVKMRAYLISLVVDARGCATVAPDF